MGRIRAIVADDHSLFRRGVVDLLQTQSDMTVVGQASNGKDAIELAAQLAPDLVLLDVSMPGLDGIGAATAICQMETPPKVLMLTVSEDAGTLYSALAAGASGYVLKTARPEEILDAVRQVAQGWVLISPALARFFLRSTSANQLGRQKPSTPYLMAEHGLTSREQEVFRLIAQGHTNEAIAKELTITIDTVKSHVRSILSKLQLASKRDVSIWARQQGDLLF